ITRFHASRAAHHNRPRIKEKRTGDLTLSAAGSRHELQAAPTIFGEDDRGAVTGESDHLTSIAVIEAAEAATATRSKIKGLHYQRPQLPAPHRERIASLVSRRGSLSVLIARPIRLVVGKNLAGQQVSAAAAEIGRAHV